MSGLLTRRDFLRTAGTSFLGMSLAGGTFEKLFGAQKSKQARFYVGTYTDTTSKGIYQGWIDLSTGELRTEIAAQGVENPSFVAIARSGRFLYAVNEVATFKGAQTGSVSAFAVEASSGKLTLLNIQASGGMGPCHVALDRTGKVLLVANYSSGTAAVFPVLDNGSLAPASSIVTHHGSGPNHDRQESPHAHCVAVTPDNRFVIVVDLGIDRLMVYELDTQHGLLTPAKHPFVALAPGSGPRHIVFHPDGKSAFVINELHSSIVRLSYEATAGQFTIQQTISTLPPDYHGQNTAAEICVDARGKYLYCSNRGHDSIAVFEIAHTSRRLTGVQYQPTQGSTPRSFALDPSGRYLLVSNQRSDSIATFAVDGKRGVLSPIGHSVAVAEPVCVQFVENS